jgi:hypothetical protein
MKLSKKAYFICNEYPFPQDTGGKKRIFLFHQFLMEIFQEVVIVCPQPEIYVESEAMNEKFIFYSTRKTKFYERFRLLPLFNLHFLSSQTIKMIWSLQDSDSPSEFFFSHSYLVPRLQRGLSSYSLDLANIESERYLSLSKLRSGKSKLSSFFEFVKAIYWEKSVVKNAKVIFTCTKYDHNQILRMNPNAVFLPNEYLLAAGDFSLSSSNHKVLIFGNWEYLPNTMGLKWFLDSVWMGVIKQKPEATLSIAGKGSNLLELSKELLGGCSVLGEFESLSSICREHDLLVFPTSHGAGQQLKVVEGLLTGRVGILTSHSYRSVPEELKILAFESKSTKEFIDQIILFLEDDDLRHQHEKLSQSVGFKDRYEESSEQIKGIYG